MRNGSRLRQIGWAVALAVCVTLFVALTFRVNAIKSDVRLAEREVIALSQEKKMLEIEFQTRANQQQLADYNRVDFGYQAPAPDQYLENERQLSNLGLPRGARAPDPIRVARAPSEEASGAFPSMVSPLTGEPVSETETSEEIRPAENAEQMASEDVNPMNAAQSLSERLALDSPLGGQVAEIVE